MLLRYILYSDLNLVFLRAGYIIYFSYGIWHSTERALQSKEKKGKDTKNGSVHQINMSVMPNEKGGLSSYNLSS